MVLVNGYFFKEAISRIDYGRRIIDWQYPDRNDFKPQTLEVFIERKNYFLKINEKISLNIN
jgi:hypothetical protein